MKIMVLLWSTSGKRIVTLSLLSFSLIFLFGPFLFFLWPLFIWASLASFFILFFVRSLIPTYGGIIVSIILSSLGQCSNNEDHHTFIYLQLKNYNSILRTKYDYVNASDGVPGCATTQEWHVWHYGGGFATNTMPTTWSCKEQYDNDGVCHNKRNGGKLHGNISRNGYGNAIIGRYGGCFEEGKWRVYNTGKSCTAIYLGIYMEMPW